MIRVSDPPRKQQQIATINYYGRWSGFTLHNHTTKMTNSQHHVDFLFLELQQLYVKRFNKLINNKMY